MDDGDHEGPKTALHSDPRFIVATTLATLVIAGSAFIWRSNPRNIVGISHHHQLGESAHEDPDSVVTSDNDRPGPETSKSPSSSSKGSTAGTAIIIRDELGEESEAKEAKASRPKERRRRGKDPLKDILKNAKKSKLLAKPSRTGDSEDGGTGQLPKINEVTRHSRVASQATSSRSISSASNRRSPLPTQDRASPYPSSNQGSHTGDGDDEDEDEDEEDTPPAASSSTPRLSTSLETQQFSSSLAAPDPDTSSSILVSNPSHASQSNVSPNIPLFSSSSASKSTSIFSSDSAITPNTSPTLSLSGKTPTLAPAEVPPHAQSKPLVASVSSPAVRPSQKAVGPWDWDGVGSTVKPDATYRKPPRFRSKSRGSGSIPISPTIPVSASLDTYSSDLPSSSSCVSTASAISSGSLGSHEDISLSFTFPSLNASANPSSCSQASPGPSRAGITSHFNGNGIASVSNNVPRRAPTPRRPPTPLSGTSTPPPSLSTQTQLASLRGALEAARLREEKTKGDIERYSKELEIMRWESTALRRREAELQTQVHHLVHQVQTYAAVFASMGPPSQHPQHHMPPNTNPNSNGPANSAPNGYQFSPSSSSTNPHSPPPHLQIPSAQILLGNGVLSPSSMLSPMSMAHTSPHSPFYPYASHSPHHMHVQQQQQQAQSPHQPSNNLFSMLFRHPVSASGAPASGASSVAGSSSVGSHSPDLSVPSLSTSPPQPVSVDDRGRRRTRTRTQTAGPRIGGSGGGAWDGDGSDGWVVGDDEIPADEDIEGSYSDDDDEEGSVSEVLADAILKRPGSIRGLSKKGKFKEKEKEKEVQHTEFTFPSLSDFGNVSRAYPVPIEVPIREKDLARVGNDEAANDNHIKTDEEVMQAPQPATTNNELEVTSFDVQ